jgi:hypothetical protein
MQLVQLHDGNPYTGINFDDVNDNGLVGLYKLNQVDP